MKKIIILLLLICPPTHAKSTIESWIGHSLLYKTSKKLTAEIYQELDTYNMVTNPYFYILETTLHSKYRDNSLFSSGFRFGKLKSLDGNWTTEISPLINFSHKIKLNKDRSFELKVGLAYRVLDYVKNRGVLKLSGRFNVPYKDRLNFFISNKIMHGYNGFNQIDENRARLGVDVTTSKHSSLGIHYLSDIYKDPIAVQWKLAHVIEIIIGTSF